jgi:hypothetical protein
MLAVAVAKNFPSEAPGEVLSATSNGDKFTFLKTVQPVGWSYGLGKAPLENLREESVAMHKILLTIGLVAVLSACTRDSKPQKNNQAQSTSVPGLVQTGQRIGQAASTVPSNATVNSPPTSMPATPTQSAPEATNPAQPNGPTRPALVQGPPPKPSAFQPAKVPLPTPATIIPEGTPIRVRLEQAIDTRRNRSGDRFEATLISPIRVNGNLVVPRGSTFEGHVTEAKPSGRFKGRAVLGIELDSFHLNGAVHRVVTAPDTRVSGRHRKRNWILLGGGSGLGAALGAVAGGGAGALIGAGAGAGAGAVGAFFTGRKNVSLPIETPLTFRLRAGVALTSGRQPG